MNLIPSFSYLTSAVSLSNPNSSSSPSSSSMAGDTPQPTTIDSSHPLYIHSSDSSISALPTIKLNEQNYAHWRRSMQLALGARNKYSFVLGKVDKPTDLLQLLQWERCNDLVSNWLVNSVEDNIAPSIMFRDSAKKIWDELQSRYGKANRPRIYQLKKQISTLTQGSQSVSSYFSRLKSLWDELQVIQSQPNCFCDATKQYQAIQEEDHLDQFLMGLNDSYQPIRGNILSMSPSPDVDKAYNLILQEEHQRQITNPVPLTSDSLAFLIQNNLNPINNPPLNSTRRPRYFCTHCNLQGHSIERCFKLHPELKKNRRPAAATISQDSRPTPPHLTQEQFTHLVSLLKNDQDKYNASPLNSAVSGEILRACEAIYEVRAEVDKISQKVYALQEAVHSGNRVDDKEFIIATELLMVQLLKLDGIEAEGEAKSQRKNEVRRVQGFVDMLDGLKANNGNPFGISSSSTVSANAKGKEEVGVCWKLPSNMYVKLNCDGVWDDETRNGGMGAIIRTEEGGWIVGCSGNIRAYCALASELYALWEGLKLAWTYGFAKVEVEVDAEEIINLLNGLDTSEHILSTLLMDINSMIQKPWELVFNNTKREANAVAHCLAREGMGHDLPIKVYHQCPEFVEAVFHVDRKEILRGHSKAPTIVADCG